MEFLYICVQPLFSGNKNIAGLPLMQRNSVNECAPAYKFMQCFHFSLLHNVIHSKIGQNGSGKDHIQRFCGPKTEIPQDLMLLRCWRYSNLKEITLNLVYWASNLEIIQKSKFWYEILLIKTNRRKISILLKKCLIIILFNICLLFFNFLIDILSRKSI